MLGAIGYYYKNLHATYEVLNNFRTFYPLTNIVVINDGGLEEIENIAKTFHAHYINSKNLGCGDNLDDIEVMIQWVERFFKAVEYIQEPYFIILEDDVLLRQTPTIDNLPGEMMGLNENILLPEKVTSYLKQFNNNVIEPRTYYSGAGGCILNTEFYKKISQEDWKTEIYTYAELSKRFSKTEQSWYFSDCILSFLCLRYGGQILKNPQLCDLNIHSFNPDAAIYHHHHRLSTNHTSPYQTK